VPEALHGAESQSSSRFEEYAKVRWSEHWRPKIKQDKDIHPRKAEIHPSKI
jgi:hypothetical protein